MATDYASSLESIFEQIEAALRSTELAVAPRKLSPEEYTRTIVDRLQVMEESRFPIERIAAREDLVLEHGHIDAVTIRYVYRDLSSDQWIGHADQIGEGDLAGYVVERVRERFRFISENYTICLTALAASPLLDFQGIQREDVLLPNLISYYQEIIRSPEAQVSIFLDDLLVLPKPISDLFLQAVITLLENRLTRTNPNYKPKASGLSGIPMKKVKRNDLNKSDLTRDQSVLLAYLLRQHGAMMDHTDSELARVVGRLTGFSEDQIRKKLSLSEFEAYIPTVDNIKAVEAVLQSMQDDLEKRKKKFYREG